MDINAIFKALAEPNRRAILDLLIDGEKMAGEIASQFQISAPAVSQHLKVLTKAGVLNLRRDGTRRLYSINPEAFKTVITYSDTFSPK